MRKHCSYYAHLVHILHSGRQLVYMYAGNSLISAEATKARFGATQRTLKPATQNMAATGFFGAAE